MAAKIKKGDQVIIRSGKDKGRQGRVLLVMPSENMVVVEGAGVIRRHTKPSKEQAGGIVAKESPIPISKVAMIDPKDGKPTRVGFKINDKGEKQRIARRSGALLS